MHILSSELRKILLVPNPPKHNLRATSQKVSVDHCFFSCHFHQVKHEGNTNFGSKWADFVIVS
jgi:hypothetical protein